MCPWGHMCHTCHCMAHIHVPLTDMRAMWHMTQWLHWHACHVTHASMTHVIAWHIFMSHSRTCVPCDTWLNDFTDMCAMWHMRQWHMSLRDTYSCPTRSVMNMTNMYDIWMSSHTKHMYDKHVCQIYMTYIMGHGTYVIHICHWDVWMSGHIKCMNELCHKNTLNFFFYFFFK